MVESQWITSLISHSILFHSQMCHNQLCGKCCFILTLNLKPNDKVYKVSQYILFEVVHHVNRD